MNKNLIYFLAVFMTVSAFTNAQSEQEEKERLNGGSITVVKPYDPTISDAFKIKSIPIVNDTTKIKKKAVTYSIFSVPVASTFTPATGTLSKLKPRQRPQYFDNYARIGLGNFTNALAEFSGNFEVDRESNLGLYLNHNSSQGGIQQAFFDDDYSDTSLDISYGQNTNDLSWAITAGGRYQTANLYGVYEPLRPLIVNPDDVDAGVNYLSYGLGGRLNFYDAIFKDLDVKFTGTTSSFDASEIRFRVQPRVGFDVAEQEIALGLDVDYLKGNFDQQGLVNFAPEYNYLSSTLNPSINLYGDNFKAALGARINYLSDITNSDGKLNFYPAINASYILADEFLVAFTDIGGGLDMNSLQQFADENTFLAPSLAVMPTSRQVDAKLGIRGKLTEQLSYKIYGGYKSEENRAFYTKDGPTTVSFGAPIYSLGNVFYTQYADLNTTSFGGALSFDVNTSFNLTFNAESLSYDVKNGINIGNTPSHLPKFKADLVGNLNINEKWNVGTTVYFVGEREVWRNGEGASTLDSFVDLNLDINYKLNPKLTAFLRGNNLTGGNYEFYQDYSVQGVQVMGGAVYKFDF